MTRSERRKQERRWRRGDLLAVLGALVVGAALAWTVLTVQQLAEDLRTANGARDALAQQVERLGGKPVAGPPGSRGEPGRPAPGPRGSRGPEGSLGPTGKPGKDGDDGQAGEAGHDGEHGPSGTPGQGGDKGESGADGAAGVDGQQGPAGEPGPAGPPGAQGEPGPAGERGAQGPPPSSWTFEYQGVTYTCTPTAEGSSNYSCSGDEPEPKKRGDRQPEAAALDPQRRQYP